MEQEIKNCIQSLKKGGIIVYPTDTIWGIGCDATNMRAVKRIYKLKCRAEEKKMIVLVDSREMLEKYVENVPDIAWDLIDSIKKPLTVIYPNAKNLPKNLIHPDGSIAIRITRDEFSQRLVREFKKPIVSTSANISGEPVPLSFRTIAPQIIKGCDYVVNLYHDTINEVKPSTIIRLKNQFEFEIIRP